MRNIRVKGYGSVFNNKDTVGDIVLQGAFAASITAYHEREEMPPMLKDHTFFEEIGKWDHLCEDEHGLYIEGELNTYWLDQEDRRKIKRGGKLALSIGFTCPLPRGRNRILKEINLIEISIVDLGLNLDTYLIKA